MENQKFVNIDRIPDAVLVINRQGSIVNTNVHVERLVVTPQRVSVFGHYAVTHDRAFSTSPKRQLETSS